MAPEHKMANILEGWFKKISRSAIALSGGIDSSLVAFAARKMLGRDNVVAIISASASVKQKELEDARQFCLRYDIPLREIDAGEIEDPEYAANPVNRCYFCKNALYREIEEIIRSLYPGFTILNGNNFSDFGDYRPGLEAADQHRVLSPLAECRMTKDDIRLLARHYGLPNWNKPASPCLASRFPYGESINRSKLRMVEKAEDVLNDFGFDDVRVRYFDNSARIEVPATEIETLKARFTEIARQVSSIGFRNVEIDQEGLVSGKLNRGISKTG